MPEASLRLYCQTEGGQARGAFQRTTWDEGGIEPNKSSMADIFSHADMVAGLSLIHI